MGPKFDPNEVYTIYVRAIGGEGAGNTLAQKVGPLGIPAKKVQEDIIKATQEYKGLRVRVKLTIQNRVATVLPVPSTACLIIKALKEPSRDRKKEKHIKHHGSLSLQTVIDIAKTVKSRSMAVSLSGTLREVLGTCSSMGCLVDGIAASEMSAKVAAGEVDVPTA